MDSQGYKRGGILSMPPLFLRRSQICLFVMVGLSAFFTRPILPRYQHRENKDVTVGQSAVFLCLAGTQHEVSVTERGGGAAVEGAAFFYDIPPDLEADRVGRYDAQIFLRVGHTDDRPDRRGIGAVLSENADRRASSTEFRVKVRRERPKRTAVRHIVFPQPIPSVREEQRRAGIRADRPVL